MPRIALMTNQFGYTPTSCDCSACASLCAKRPGPYTPVDIDNVLTIMAAELPAMGDECDVPSELEESLATLLGYDRRWLFRRLAAVVSTQMMASPGATVLTRLGTVERIPTIIPRFNESGCMHLTEDRRCRIHARAPYGCRYFDTHQDVAAYTARSMAALVAIANAHAQQGLYPRLWAFLCQFGIASAPTENWREGGDSHAEKRQAAVLGEAGGRDKT